LLSSFPTVVWRVWAFSRCNFFHMADAAEQNLDCE
jgi:hypothetical protein